MKAYGPYVTSRVLAEGDVTTLRGVDRLTGIPVVVHLLPRALDLPALDHPALLPYTDAGAEGPVPYAVTALP
ncbi:hypothetical protein, partial [Deinococcus pimensis]|uniref:hypothetical protein n=1 Tax=Deinococcus pimensis TaxID=309888 RepID=UPI0005EB53C4